MTKLGSDFDSDLIALARSRAKRDSVARGCIITMSIVICSALFVGAIVGLYFLSKLVF